MLNIVTLPGSIDPSEIAFVIVACKALWISRLSSAPLIIKIKEMKKLIKQKVVKTIFFWLDSISGLILHPS